MRNSYFRFKQFILHQDKCAMKVTTDACLFGAWAAAEIIQRYPGRTECLDIGTGTGLLSLMLAQTWQEGVIDAVEIDPEAAEQARENIGTSPFSGRIAVYKEDIKKFAPRKKYGIIIANPPFYEKELKATGISKNRAHHSSDLTLGELLSCIKNLLAEDGRFFLLLPFKRKEEATALLKNAQLGILQQVYVNQTQQHDSFRLIIEGTHYKESTAQSLESEIPICTTPETYSEEFTRLLKTFYLNL